MTGGRGSAVGWATMRHSATRGKAWNLHGMGMFAKALRAKLNRTKGLLERSSHRGEINRSQKGRAVRFTAAAHRQRAKREENKERERERERERRVDGRGRRRCKKKMNEVARPGKKEAE